MVRQALALPGFLLAACTTVRLVHVGDLEPPHRPTRVWVTRSDRSIVALDSAQVVGDTLIGTMRGKVERLAVSEVSSLRAREPSDLRTGELILAVVVGASAAVTDLAFRQTGPQTHGCPYLCLTGASSPCCPN